MVFRFVFLKIGSTPKLTAKVNSASIILLVMHLLTFWWNRQVEHLFGHLKKGIVSPAECILRDAKIF